MLLAALADQFRPSAVMARPLKGTSGMRRLLAARRKSRIAISPVRPFPVIYHCILASFEKLDLSDSRTSRGVLRQAGALLAYRTISVSGVVALRLSGERCRLRERLAVAKSKCRRRVRAAARCVNGGIDESVKPGWHGSGTQSEAPQRDRWPRGEGIWRRLEQGRLRVCAGRSERAQEIPKHC